MVTDEQIIDACKNSITMTDACSKVQLHWNTFRRRAIQLNVFKLNQGRKGINRPDTEYAFGKKVYKLQDILDGKHPQYQSNKLRTRLINTGVKEHKCEICKLTEWNNFPIPLELNHIDGNKHNHLLENLEIICPNCHAQTSTYRGKNVKK
jgi:5-methylcytosine-specific restriction endonuclease McrA